MEIINKVQKEILSQFGDIPDSKEFYLTGGTALSFFYLRHRKSNDLDFFTNNPELTLPFSYNLEENLKKINCLTQRQRGLHSFVELVATERINTFKEDSPEMLLLCEKVDFKEMPSFFNHWREKITKELIK